MCAVCRTESVVYINVAKGREFLGERRIVLGFTCVETDIFEKNGFAVFKSGDLSLCVFTNDILSKSDLAVEKLIQAIGNRLQGEFDRIVLFCFFEKFCFCGSLFCFRKSFYLFLFFLIETEAFGKDGMRFAHMGAEDDLSALAKQVLNGRDSGDDTLIAGDNAVLKRYVEIAADKHALTGYIYVFYGFFV